MKRKGIIITIVLILLVLAAGGGAWYYLGHNSSDPVYVYQFDFVGMTEYWGDTRESYGPVSTDRIQTVFLSDTQSVTEIAVKEGDTVKKGDLLMAFDTTLSDIALERKRLEVEKVKLQLEDANMELWSINSMKPMSVPTNTPKPSSGSPLEGDYQIPEKSSYDGSSVGKAIVIWLKDSTNITDAILEEARALAERLQNENAQPDVPDADPDPEPDPDPDPDPNPDPDPEPTPEPIVVNDFFVVFKITEGNMTKGSLSTWQGARIIRTGGTFVFRLFNAGGCTDYSRPKEAPKPQIDYGSGFTAAEIGAMRVEQQKTIADLEKELKMKEAEYKIMEAEVSDGKVYAETDGVVISLLSEEEARMNLQPILKVSGGGGFYVEGSVSELERDQLQIGQEVQINDWENGGTYTGTIQEIRDFPSGSGRYYGMGNPSASQYPFVVFVDESADLREGSYVSVEYSASGSENGIYLQNPFLRTEQGRSFVYVMGEDGRLEERTVVTGKSLWGSYTEIRSGLTLEDKIAFPYGKNVKPGAKAAEGDLGNLYGY